MKYQKNLQTQKTQISEKSDKKQKKHEKSDFFETGGHLNLIWTKRRHFRTFLKN